MAEIYRHARQVCVHLGSMLMSEEVVVHFLQHLGNRCSFSFSDDREDPHDIDRNNELIKASALATFGSTDLGELHNFFDLPWFHRRWTFQEIVHHNYRRPALMFCGHQVISWVHLAACLPILAYTSLITERTRNTIRVIWTSSTLSRTLYRIDEPGTETPTILALLNLCHTLQCSDTRDTLYALWSCAGDIHGSSFARTSSPNMRIRLDYTSSAEAVFKAFAREYIRSCANLDILNFVGAFHLPQRFRSLPSWVLHWQGPRHYQPLLHPFRFKAGILPLQSTLSRPYEKAREELVCAGLRIDKIVDRSEGGIEKLRSGFVSEYMVHCMQPVLRCRLLSGSVEACEACLRDLFTAMTADCAFLPFEKPLITNTLLSTEAEDLEILQALSTTREEITKVLTTIFLEQTPADGLSLKQKVVADILCEVMSGRCVFTTRDGMIGIGPADMKIGDDLTILAYATTPFILRQTLSIDKFTVVGDCFVRGLMTGEFLQNNIDMVEEIILV